MKEGGQLVREGYWECFLLWGPREACKGWSGERAEGIWLGRDTSGACMLLTPSHLSTTSSIPKLDLNQSPLKLAVCLSLNMCHVEQD